MARERAMARPALEEAAANIAAEQRAVRANFIFLLGGEIEDEEVEAETSSEIAEGRFANKARQEIVGATVLMGRVERALTAVSTKEALPLGARGGARAAARVRPQPLPAPRAAGPRAHRPGAAAVRRPGVGRGLEPRAGAAARRSRRPRPRGRR